MTIMSVFAFIILLILCPRIVKGQSETRLPSFTTTIRKCCAADQILDDRQKCVKLPDHLSKKDKATYIRTRFWDTFCQDSKCRDLRFKTVGFATCPSKQKIEVHYLDAFPNGSLNIGTRETSILVTKPNGCGDLTLPLDPEGEPEGPIYIFCRGSVDAPRVPETNGVITKCCPKDQILDQTQMKCVSSSEHPIANSYLQWPHLLPRRIREPHTGLATPVYHINILGDGTGNSFCPENEEPHLEKPHLIYTNGSALFGQDIGNVSCIETATSEDGPVIGPISLLCKQKQIPTNPNKNKVAEPNLDNNKTSSKNQDEKTITSDKKNNHTDPRVACINSGGVCLPKCCRANEVFNVDEKIMQCEQVNESKFYQEDVYKFELTDEGGKNRSYNLSLEVGAKVVSSYDYIMYMHTSFCPDGYGFLPQTTRVLHLSSGYMFIDNGVVAEIYTEGFCIDNFVVKSSGEPYVSALVCNNVVHSIRLPSYATYSGFADGLCSSAAELKHFNKTLRLPYTLCGIISLFFLAITLFVYLTLPSLRNLQGRIVIANVFSIFVTTLLLVISYNVKKESEYHLVQNEMYIPISHAMCSALGYSLYCVGISMFCWMSVMCFDLYWTFGRTTLPRYGRRGSPRLIGYLAFGVGAPLLVTMIAILLDTYQVGSILPGVGGSRCFLSMAGVKAFFYHPILALLCFNTLMFLLTIISLWRSRRANQMARLSRISVGRSDRGSKQENNADLRNGKTGSTSTSHPSNMTTTTSATDTRDQLILFSKLFVIMGLAWLSECIHVELHGNHENNEHCDFYAEILLRGIGGLNMIRGFFIFLVFICKKSVWDMTRKRHPKMLKFFCFPIDCITGNRNTERETGSTPDLVGDLVHSGREQYSLLPINNPEPTTPITAASREGRDVLEADTNFDLSSIRRDNSTLGIKDSSELIMSAENYNKGKNRMNLEKKKSSRASRI